MSNHVAASASMAMAGEALQGWNKLEDKLASKLAQLTKLLHHFSAFPPESLDGNDDEIAGQHESEIHEILNETASRIRQFKMSLEIQIQDNRLQETIQAMSRKYEVLREASETELKAAKSNKEQLEKDMKELEKAMEDKNESFVRDSMLLRNELLKQTNEFESAKQTYFSEIDRLKRAHETEMLAQSEKAQKDSLEVTQQQIQLHARVVELQETAREELEERTQALEETKALYKADLERLKLESFIELEKMSQDCASREAEWHAQELDYQRKLTEAANEKMQITLSSRIQAEEGMSLLEASKQALTKEKQMTTKLQNDLRQAEEENRTLKETLKAALINKDNLAIAFENLKEEALNSENLHSSAISEWESKANRLGADLENMTNACAVNENDVKHYKIKVDELAFQLITNRKEMSLMVMEIDKLRKELQISNLEVAAKEEERRRVEGEAEIKVRTLTAENEESCRKMKEMVETRIQEQILVHEKNVQSLQNSFLSQLEEHRKGSELQLESMEEKLLGQKEEKACAKEACVEYMKSLRAVEQKMEDQETKLLSQFDTYEKKIVELVEKLDRLESKGPSLEDGFNSLLKQVLRHTHQSKQVGLNLQESQAELATLEKKLTAMTQEYGARTMSYSEEIALLRQTLSEVEREHKLAIATASESHAYQIQQCMNDMQRLKEGHNRALAELVREHTMEIGALSSEIQAQKTQQEESGDAIEGCKKAYKEAVIASEAVSQKLAHELYDLKEDHMMQIQEMTENFEIRLSSIEREWKHRLKTVEESWENRLEHQEATSKKQFQSDLHELKTSLLKSFTEEKLKLETEQKNEVGNLRARISELRALITQKDERMKGLLEVIQKLEENSRVAIQEMKTSHEQKICDMMEKQRAELDDLQKEGSAVTEELQTKHRSELEASHRSAEKAKLQMRGVKHDLEEKLEKLQKRFESREPREEDVIRLMKLQETCLQKDSTIQQLHDKASQLRLELVNREETYNRIFGNSPTVQQGVSDWLRPRPKPESGKVDSSRMKVAMETSKVDIVKLQKRAASVRRMAKGPEPIIRSASNQL